jgi:hypothetical protein
MTGGDSMKAEAAVCSIFLSLAVSLVGNGTDQPYKEFVKEIEKRYLPFRANEAVCSHTYSTWDNRPIYKCRFTRNGNLTAINGVSDWAGKYFVSARKYKLRSTRFDKGKDTLELKLWAEALSGLLQDEMQIQIPDVSELDAQGLEQIFFGAFFRPSEDQQAYEADINKKLIQNYIDPEPELFLLPLATREKILSAIRLMGFPPQPKLERVGQDLYIPANLIADTSVYNDLRVSENQRLATTIEKKMKEIRLLAEKAGEVPTIKGIRFQWRVYHKDLTNEKAAPTEEEIEFLVPLQRVSEFAGGNLSAFELVQKSLLRADGIKVTLTSFDPIGAQ